jgi:hypothetical protein
VFSRSILVGILVVAAAATAADWIWYTRNVPHCLSAGVAHGALLLTVVGGVLGAAASRTVRGLPIGTIAGVAGALTYFLVIETTGGKVYGPAIGVAWVVTWLVLAALEGRWLRAPVPRGWIEIALRGVAAALLSGIGFYLVFQTLWGEQTEERNWALQFVAWAVAWGPGLIALSQPFSRRPASRA